MSGLPAVPLAVLRTCVFMKDPVRSVYSETDTLMHRRANREPEGAPEAVGSEKEAEWSCLERGGRARHCST